MIDEGRTFHCSELVTKAYKCCGITKETTRSSARYLPGDLSIENNSLNLIAEAELSPEIFVITNPQKR